MRSLNNVNTIVNELAFRPASSFSSRTNDSYLERRVKTALIAEKNISANNYKVVCERGSVYLMGLVTIDEGNRGADVASRVPGVVQVVKVFQYIQPEEAAAAATAAATAPVAASSAGCRRADGRRGAGFVGEFAAARTAGARAGQQFEFGASG